MALEGSLEDQLFSHWSGPRVDGEGSTCEVGKISGQRQLLVSENLWAGQVCLNAPRLKLGFFLCGFEIRAARLHPTLASLVVSSQWPR